MNTRKIFLFSIIIWLVSNNITAQYNEFNHAEMLQFYNSTGMDSLGQKQGIWSIETQVLFLLDINTDKRIIINEGVFELGYYIDNRKEGIWEVKQWEKDETGFQKALNLLAHRLYYNDSLLYEIQYEDKKVRAILKQQNIFEHNNMGHLSEKWFSDVIWFNKNGEVVRREYLSPTKILKKEVYNKTYEEEKDE